jgi:RNA polymerase sigma-70 factor (ECF subfamily)
MFEIPCFAAWDPARLVRAALAGDSDAFGELMRRARPQVLGLIRRQARGTHDVEELYQEVTLRAYRSLHRLREPDRFHGWVMQITYCTSVDWVRRRILARVSRPLEHDPPDALGIHRRGAADPERCLPFLVEEIARLKPKHAAALLLRGLEGMAYREIATQLEISPACVKTYLHRARHSLRSRMARAAEEGRETPANEAPPQDPGKENEP